MTTFRLLGKATLPRKDDDDLRFHDVAREYDAILLSTTDGVMLHHPYCPSQLSAREMRQFCGR